MGSINGYIYAHTHTVTYCIYIHIYVYIVGYMYLNFTHTFILDAHFRGRKRSPRKGNSIDWDPLFTGELTFHCQGADLKAFWSLEVFRLDHPGLMKYSLFLGGVSGISKSRGGR